MSYHELNVDYQECMSWKNLLEEAYNRQSNSRFPQSIWYIQWKQAKCIFSYTCLFTAWQLGNFNGTANDQIFLYE